MDIQIEDEIRNMDIQKKKTKVKIRNMRAFYRGISEKLYAIKKKCQGNPLSGNKNT